MGNSKLRYRSSSNEQCHRPLDIEILNFTQRIIYKLFISTIFSNLNSVINVWVIMKKIMKGILHLNKLENELFEICAN